MNAERRDSGACDACGARPAPLSHPCAAPDGGDGGTAAPEAGGGTVPPEGEAPSAAVAKSAVVRNGAPPCRRLSLPPLSPAAASRTAYMEAAPPAEPNTPPGGPGGAAVVGGACECAVGDAAPASDVAIPVTVARCVAEGTSRETSLRAPVCGSPDPRLSCAAVNETLPSGSPYNVGVAAPVNEQRRAADAVPARCVASYASPHSRLIASCAS